MAKYIQKTSPNLNIGAKPGWCLQYADDVVNAPVRRYSAGVEYLAQKAAGNIHEEEPPVGLWVPVFFDITSGIYDPYEHVGWAYNHGNGRIEIHDSEVHSGARGVYNSIAEICGWFGKFGLRYLGWSERIGGVQVVEKSDNIRVVSSDVGVNVRYEPTTQSGVFATYPNGSDIEMAGWVYGENVNGDDRWFKSQRSGVYLHFSAFDEKEGSLPNLGDFRKAPQPETKATVPENKAPEFINFEKEFDFVDEVIPAHVSNQFYGRKNLKDDNGKYFGNIPEDYEAQKRFVDELQRPLSEIKHITIHNTTNTSLQATTNEFRRKESFKSAHLVVSNDKIVQVVPKGNTAFTNGTHEANYEGFTIEFLDDVTNERYVEVLKKVTKALGVNEIKLHRNWVATQCPYKISDEKFKEILDKVFDRAVEKPVEKVADNQQLTTTQPTVNQELIVEEKPKKETRKLTEEELKIMEEIKKNISEVNNSVEYSPVVSQEVKNKTYFATGWALTTIGTVATISVALLPQHATLILAISGALTGACASINQLYKISSKK